MAEQIPSNTGIKYPKYCTVAERLRTFGTWPSSNHQQPTQLSAAGFFYQGLQDRVICYSCGEELSGWTPVDDAWEEHVKFQPTCEHVLQHQMGGLNLGSSNVDEVAQGRHTVEASGDDNTSLKQNSEEVPKQEGKDTSKKRNHETVEEEIQRLRYQWACKTCFKEKACMILLPCAHLSACPICVEKLKNCNVCHDHIEATVKAYCA